MLSRAAKVAPSLIRLVISFRHSSSLHGALKTAIGIPVATLDMRSMSRDAPVPGAGLSMSAIGTHPLIIGLMIGVRNAARAPAFDVHHR